MVYGTEYTKEIAKRIKELCTNNKISVNQTLMKCSINTSFITDLNKGKMPSVDKIVNLADFFGVTTDYLLKGKENNTANDTTNEKESEGMEGKTDLEKMRELKMQGRYITYDIVKFGLEAFFVGRYFKVNENPLLGDAAHEATKTLCKMTNIKYEKMKKFIHLAILDTVPSDKVLNIEYEYPTSLEFNKMMRFDECNEEAALLLKAELEKERELIIQEIDDAKYGIQDFLKSKS